MQQGAAVQGAAVRRGLIALLCFVIAGCGGGGSGGSNIGTNVRVPDVVGQTQANASSAIVAAGLTVGTVSTSTSSTVAAGNVISQSPAAGSSVPPNTAVKLVVSTGAALATVPNVVRLTQAAATTAITSAGLTLGTVTMATSATVPSGSVISQNPAAGASVAANSAVNLTVSSGPAATAVPNVVGRTQGTATSTITAGGFVAGTITMTTSATVPSGRVISQNPAAGSSAASGSAVNLTVSAFPAGFGIGTRPALATFSLPTGGGTLGTFSVVPAFPNLAFSNSIFLSGVPGDTRLVLVQQSGQIYAFAPAAGGSGKKLILDLSSKVVFNGEEGLLGLAMDRDFATNRFFYVDYTRQSDGAVVVARYTWSSGTDVADPASEKIIITIPHPNFTNHNGGMIAFGPDNMLYIALGDGGFITTPSTNSQNMSILLGKILRIDVHPANDTTAYLVPADNPFVSNASVQKKEIWAYGLRNPFRFSFDRVTGQMLIADVGQADYEEIDIGMAGANYGWPQYEGNQHACSQCLPGTLAGPSPATAPIFEYSHSATGGCAIIGGYVYRGTGIASLIGKFLYTDYCAGTVWSLDNSTNPPTNLTLTGAVSPTSFGQDNNGELYITSQGGGVYQLQESGGGGGGATLLSQTGLFTDLSTLTPANGLIEYDLNMPFWSDGALKRRWVGIPQGAAVTFSPTGAWTFPVGTVIVKHFEMQMTDGDPSSARRLETRVLTRTASAWMGFTYRWNAGETDADLLSAGTSEVLTIQASGGGTRMQTYEYPSSTDCLRCHTTAAGFALGLATRELNRDFDYGAVTDNELRTLNHIGYFTSSINTASSYDAYPAIDDANFPVATRARAYLAVNCAQCHRPGGPTNVNLDFRFDTADASMNAINVTPTQGDLGIGASARIIAPGAKANSVLWQRIQRLDTNRMPPLASHRVDQTAVTVIGSWIDSLP
jgi:uncharacterized repeat protein (TIGR03806 family)